MSKKTPPRKKKPSRRPKPKRVAAVVAAPPFVNDERTAKERRAVVVVPVVVQVDADAKDASDRAIARTLTKPSITAASAIQAWNTEHEINALAAELGQQIKLVNDGDMDRAEGLLVAQAHTLNEIFTRLAVRSVANIKGGYIDAGETYLRLALRAQGQCRATLETLAEIKNPLLGAYVRQANFAKGHQQVNNGGQLPAQPAPAKLENTPNKLLEVMNAERLDAGATSPTIKTDTELATVGAIDRTENAARESKSSAQPVPGRVSPGLAESAENASRAKPH